MKLFLKFTALCILAFAFTAVGCGKKNAAIEERIPSDSDAVLLIDLTRLNSTPLHRKCREEIRRYGLTPDDGSGCRRIVLFAGMPSDDPSRLWCGGLAETGDSSFDELSGALETALSQAKTSGGLPKYRLRRGKIGKRQAIYVGSGNFEMVFAVSDDKLIAFGSEETVRRLLGDYPKSGRLASMLAATDESCTVRSAVIVPKVLLPFFSGATEWTGEADSLASGPQSVRIKLAILFGGDESASREAAHIDTVAAAMSYGCVETPEDMRQRLRYDGRKVNFEVEFSEPASYRLASKIGKLLSRPIDPESPAETSPENHAGVIK